jgi:hypothetical protein
LNLQLFRFDRFHYPQAIRRRPNHSTTIIDATEDGENATPRSFSAERRAGGLRLSCAYCRMK